MASGIERWNNSAGKAPKQECANQVSSEEIGADSIRNTWSNYVTMHGTLFGAFVMPFLRYTVRVEPKNNEQEGEQ